MDAGKIPITLYLDFWPSVSAESDYLAAYNRPGDKMPGTVRYKISFEIPDHRLPDVLISEGVNVEVEL